MNKNRILFENRALTALIAVAAGTTTATTTACQTATTTTPTTATTILGSALFLPPSSTIKSWMAFVEQNKIPFRKEKKLKGNDKNTPYLVG
ncbi:MAG: hypothetical protein ORN58_06935 [Sediminibacterium sp.]|nr:hypothetical protein [Sediminibacterium sp.]